jgi:hypothetical protein
MMPKPLPRILDIPKKKKEGMALVTFEITGISDLSWRQQLPACDQIQ